MVKIRVFAEAVVDTVNSSSMDPNTICNILGQKALLLQVENACFGDRRCCTRHRDEIGVNSG